MKLTPLYSLFYSLLFALACSTANAGFLDKFLGKQEDSAVSTETTSSEPSVNETSNASAEQNSGLIDSLSKQLGITDAQAEGGMGSLLGLAKDNLSSEEFSTLGSGIPNLSALLAAAPALSSQSGTGGLGGMLSSAGGLASSIGGISQLSSQFEALGLSPDMISKIASLAIEYFSGQGGDTAALLQKGLSSVLG